MKKLAVILVVVAAVAFVLGLAVKALNFMLGVAPVVLAVAVVLVLMSRFRGRRIPR